MGAQQKDRKVYRAGLYMRLSKDDEGAGESASISTQRDILRAYAKGQGIVVAGEYVDDGFSGTNYDRPDFLKMIADIEADKINCVITKDLSRLGRNSTRTTELLEEYFPAHGVRYISVTDGFDSLMLTNGMAIAAPFMILVNELYARDISQKIRSSFKSKMEKGDYIAPFAPYGYQKDPENKNHLVVDAESAGVVKMIFQMTADGYRPCEIAKILNEKHVPTPAEYRCLTHENLDIRNYSKRNEWNSPILCKILRNKVYLGRTVQGKTTKVSFKSKETRAIKPDEWITVEGTHEAIISDDLFEQVRRRVVSRRCVPKKGFVNVFSGIAKCADCGRNMTTAPTRKKGSTYNLCCGGYKSYGAAECGNHFIEYDLLYKVVLEELRTMLALSETEREDILSALAQDEKERKAAAGGKLDDVLKSKEKRLHEVNILVKKAFELFALGGQSESTYTQLIAEYEKERSELEQSIRTLRSQLSESESKEDQYRRFFALLDEVQSSSSLSPDLVKKLIDRIEVEQGHYKKDENGKKTKHQTVKIFYRFIGCIDNAP